MMGEGFYKYKEISMMMLVICFILGIIGFGLVYKYIMYKYAGPMKEVLLQKFYEYLKGVINDVQ